ncbi:MAG TPA: phosphatidylserine decarboxylase family protein [Syntrophorhabdaceae bacterium]
MRGSLIAREGLRFIVPSFLLFALFAMLRYPTLSLICFLFLVFFVFFFRNPKRTAIDEPDALLCPADGRVMEIRDVIDREFLDGERKRIAIFMSPLDVHVNRAPCAGRVVTVQHRDGGFAAAFKKETDQVNERNFILLDNNKERVLIVQIAGFLARRITCWVKPGDEIQKGQPVGIISFGSRVDIYLPKGYEPMVDLQERVRAGITVVARKKPEGVRTLS